MNVEFRRIGPGDAGLLQAAAEDVFDDAVDQARAEIFLGDPRNILIVAVAEGLIIGQVQAVAHAHLDAAPDLFIDNLGVTPSWRRRGVARRLIALALEAGRRVGAEEAWVLTELDNTAAQSAYRNAGAATRQTTMFTFDLTAAQAADAERRGRSPATASLQEPLIRR